MMRRSHELMIEGMAEESAEIGRMYVTWARVRLRAGNADGAVDALDSALRSRMTAKHVSRFGELASLQSRADFPSELRE